MKRIAKKRSRNKPGKSAVLHTRVEPQLRSALQEYRRRLPIAASQSAVLNTALKRFLLQAGILDEDEGLEPEEIAALEEATRGSRGYVRWRHHRR